MKKFIVLDTNIFIGFLETGFRIATQIGTYKDPEDPKILEELIKSLDDNKFKLLLPEITILEIRRIKPEKDEDLKKMYEEVMLKITDFSSITGKQIATSALSEIEDYLKNLYDKELTKNAKIWVLLEKIISHKNTEILPLNDQIL